MSVEAPVNPQGGIKAMEVAATQTIITNAEQEAIGAEHTAELANAEAKRLADIEAAEVARLAAVEAAEAKRVAREAALASETAQKNAEIVRAREAAEAARTHKTSAIEKRSNSVEVSALNDKAQLEIYGSGNATYLDASGNVIASPDKPMKGKIDDIRKNPKYGKTQADRDKVAAEYEHELDRLTRTNTEEIKKFKRDGPYVYTAESGHVAVKRLEVKEVIEPGEGLELTQAKLVLDLREKDHADQATLTGKFIAEGMEPRAAFDKAQKFYDKKDADRIKLIKENGVFSMDDYKKVLKRDELYPVKKEVVATSGKEDGTTPEAQSEEDKLLAGVSEKVKADDAAAAERQAMADELSNIGVDASGEDVEAEASGIEDLDLTELSNDEILELIDSIENDDSLSDEEKRLYASIISAETSRRFANNSKDSRQVRKEKIQEGKDMRKAYRKQLRQERKEGGVSRLKRGRLAATDYVIGSRRERKRLKREANNGVNRRQRAKAAIFGTSTNTLIGNGQERDKSGRNKFLVIGGLAVGAVVGGYLKHRYNGTLNPLDWSRSHTLGNLADQVPNGKGKTGLAEAVDSSKKRGPGISAPLDNGGISRELQQGIGVEFPVVKGGGIYQQLESGLGLSAADARKATTILDQGGFFEGDKILGIGKKGGQIVPYLRGAGDGNFHFPQAAIDLLRKNGIEV